MAQGIGRRVVQPVRAARAVGPGIHQIAFLRLVGIGNAYAAIGKAGFEPLAEEAFLLVEVVAHRLLVARAISREQFFAPARVTDARQVVAFVFKQQFQLLARSRIHAHEHGFVAADVGCRIHLAVVGSKLHETHHVAEVRGQHGAERLILGFAVENLRVYSVHYGSCHTQAALVVGHPALVVSGVLHKQGQLARLQVEAVRVEHLGVTAVQPHHHLSRHLFQIVDKRGAHSGEIGVCPPIRSIGPHPVEAVVFIATRVFHKEQAVVLGPHVPGQAALRFGGKAQRLFLRRVEAAHKEVQTVGIGGHV